MKRTRWTALVIATTLLAAACGADGGDGSSTTTTTTRDSTTSTTSGTSGGDVTREALSQALLTVDDLPSGYEKTAENEPDSDDNELEAVDAACQDALDTLDAANNEDDDATEANVTFERDQVAQVMHAAKAVPDAGDRLERVRTTLEDDCDNRIEFTSEGTDDGVLEIESGDQHGDGTFYAKMTFTNDSDGTEVRASAYIVYLANPDVGSIISTLTVDVPSEDVDTDPPTLADAEDLAAAAQARYEEAFG